MSGYVAPETFVAHHKSPINEYDFLAIRVGFTTQPVTQIEGRLCYVADHCRVSRAGQRRTSYSAMIIRFLDDGSARRMTAGEFAKTARTPKLPQPIQEGT